MESLIAADPRNGELIRPYIGGEEVNVSASQKHHRYIIDFFDRPLRRGDGLKDWDLMTETERSECLATGIVPQDFPGEVAESWPKLLAIVDRLVRPLRLKQKRKAHRVRWWQFADKRPGLYQAVSLLDRVLVTNCGASPHLAFAFLPTGIVYAHTLTVIAFSGTGPFAVLQSRVHELWARFFSSTLEERLRYTPSDCFRTFPFPEGFERDATIQAIGESYYTFRANLMVSRDEGLTNTYNRFHARGEHGADIARLRVLHGEMDAAVLRAYGWDDLVARAAPEFIEQEADEGKTPKTRLDWPSEFKEEVLAHLLALNAERAQGLVPGSEDEGGEIDDGESEEDDPT